MRAVSAYSFCGSSSSTTTAIAPQGRHGRDMFQARRLPRQQLLLLRLNAMLCAPESVGGGVHRY